MSSNNKILGICLDTLSCDVVKNNHVEQRKLPKGKNIPPAVIWDMQNGNSLSLDQWFPASPIGTGEVWPPEARVGEGISPRMPIGLLWDHAFREQVWHCSSDVSVDPTAACGVAARDLTSSIKNCKAAGLVIPNWLRQYQQQGIINALSGSGVKWRLIWRPVAAAAYWIDKFRAKLSTNRASQRKVIGKIVCLHVGLFESEYTVVEIVEEPHDRRSFLLPARLRPNLKLGFRPGMIFGQLLKHVKSRFSSGDIDLQTWKQLWATPWLKRQIEAWQQRAAGRDSYDCPPDYDPELRQINSSGLENGDLNCAGIKWPTNSVASIQKWIAKRGESTTSQANAVPVLGAVVTGELAAVSPGSGALGYSLLKSHVPPERILVASANAADDVLAIGAQKLCERMEARLPAYLDSLPLVRTVVSRAGEPEWIPLLSDGNQYVRGGERWARPEPITGIRIPKADELKLAIDHEDFATVREATIAIPKSLPPGQAAALHVAITPAHGNARVEVKTVPEVKLDLPLVADLQRMSEVKDSADKPLTPEQYLDWYPRISPPVLPRLSNDSKWEKAKSRIKGILKRRIAAWDLASLRLIRDSLRDKSQAMYPRNATAVGSNGVAPNSHNVLTQFCEGLLQLIGLQDDREETAKRCLAYASFQSAALETLAAKYISVGYISDDATLRLIGNCVRTPNTIDAFLRQCIKRNATGGLNDGLIRTISELSSFRPRALEQVSNRHAESIYNAVVGEFKRMSFRFRWRLSERHVMLCAAFLLRRRIFDDGFVSPDGEIAISVKTTCKEVICKAKTGQISFMGGAVDMPAVMRQLIQYIDREGRGAFVLAES